jgi:hypothetical protein
VQLWKIHSFDNPNGTNDPASWDLASYSHHPQEDLEPIEPTASEYRACALQMLSVLRGIDVFMCQTHTRRSGRKWTAVSLALGLASTSGRTETELAEEGGVCRAAVSKDVIRVLELTGLEPAFGLKREQDREIYARTNGRRRLGEHDRLGDIAGTR